MVTGRYAPSPTGDLHVGNLRTAMVAWLFAHHGGGNLRLRIDDLDPATASVEHEERQLDDLAAIGVTFDGVALRQSERLHLYDAAIDELEAADRTYPCFCSRREIREAASAPHVHLPDGAYPGTCRDLDAGQRERRAEDRPAATRVRALDAEITFVDRIHGETSTIVDDFVIRRNDGVASYNLATVIDDAAQDVDQVVRGDDLLLGTPRQIWLRQALDLPAVEHAHVPLVVNGEGARLAKRDGAVTLRDLADVGVDAGTVRRRLAGSLGLPEAGADGGLDALLESFDPGALPTEPMVWESSV